MRAKSLRVLNILLGIMLLFQITVGVFPQWFGSHQFQIHKAGAWVFLGLWLIHLYLNWGWIKGNYFKKKSAGKPEK
jgi:hypothetical protein